MSLYVLFCYEGVFIQYKVKELQLHSDPLSGGGSEFSSLKFKISHSEG
jgi:hypothetical protein